MTGVVIIHPPVAAKRSEGNLSSGSPARERPAADDGCARPVVDDDLPQITTCLPAMGDVAMGTLTLSGLMRSDGQLVPLGGGQWFRPCVETVAVVEASAPEHVQGYENGAQRCPDAPQGGERLGVGNRHDSQTNTVHHPERHN